MMSRFSLIVADQGAPVELIGEKALTRAIESGMLTRQTWVTYVDGDASGRVRATDAPGMAEMFDRILAGGPSATANRVDRDSEPEVADTSPATEESEPAEVALTDTTKQAEPEPPLNPTPDQPRYESKRADNKLPAVIFGGIGVVLLIVIIASISSQTPSTPPPYDVSPPPSDIINAPPGTVSEVLETFYASREVSIRGQGSRDGNLLGDAPRGTSFEGSRVINADGEEWLRISSGPWASGFVWVGNLRPNPRPNITPMNEEYVAIGYAEIFREPSRTAARLGAPPLQSGDPVRTIGYTSDGWVEIAVEGHGVGYVSTDLVSPYDGYDGYDAGTDYVAPVGGACREYNGRNYCEQNGEWRDAGPARAAAAPPVAPPPARTTPQPPAPTTTGSGALPAPAQPSTRANGGPSVITNPEWSRLPDAEFPERAAGRGIENGRVTLRCIVQANGSVADCSILAEDPAGAGFGQAALRGARNARLSPRTVDGAPTRSVVTFTIAFSLSD